MIKRGLARRVGFGFLGYGNCLVSIDRNRIIKSYRFGGGFSKGLYIPYCLLCLFCDLLGWAVECDSGGTRKNREVGTSRYNISKSVT